MGSVSASANVNADVGVGVGIEAIKVKFIFKRDGAKEAFDERKLTSSIQKVFEAINEGISHNEIQRLSASVVRRLYHDYIDNCALINADFVHVTIEETLMRNDYYQAAKAFILYREYRNRQRESQSTLATTVKSILQETSRENANISNSPSAKLLQIASAASKQHYLNSLIPREFADAHIKGDLHIHDLDYFAKTTTCLQLPLLHLLTNGFHNGHGFIRPPKRPSTAGALAAIIMQSNQNDQHGGQSFAALDRDLAPFVKGASERDIFQTMESLVFNLNTMHSRAGAQVPFSSINLGTDLSEEGRSITRNLLLAYEAGLGHGEQALWPNIIFRLKKGVNFYQKDPNYDLFELAVRVASHRLNPTFSFMDSSFNAPFGDQVAYMGCRSRVMSNCNGPEVTDRRGNLSFTTINLPKLAIRSLGSIDRFWVLLSEMADKTIRQLHHRYKVQAKLRVKDMPFLMGEGLYLGSENLKQNDIIEPAIKHGTLAMGFLGLAECLIMLTGKHHAQCDESQQLGIQIVSFMRDKIDAALQDYHLNYTLLATPAGGTCERFPKLDKREFGIITGITDREYYTNSYHIPVDYELPMLHKIMLEGGYHKFCNAGHISYVEMDAPPIHNLKAVIDILRCMESQDMGYVGINYPNDYCHNCHMIGVLPTNCTRCGSANIQRVRRITGYLSTVNQFNDGKLAELRDRCIHSL